MTEEGVHWEPYGYYRTKSNVAQFVDRFGYDGAADLQPETEADVARFWDAVVEDTGMVWDKPYSQTLDTSGGYAFTDWFVDGRLNATPTMLDRWVEAAPDRPAYVWENETGDRIDLTYADLERRTNRLANALRAHGVGEGDVVGIVFPLHPAAMIAALACLKIGAVQTQIFAGYGATAIDQRLADSDASLVFLADGYRRGGTRHDLVAKMESVLDGENDVETVVTYDNVGIDAAFEGVDQVGWDAFVEGHDDEAEATLVDADAPALIAYSSGTTGKPKGTIQTQASILAMGMKETRYNFDVGEGDVFCWATDFGWMVVTAYMLFGTLPLGATAVLLGGSPTAPEGDRMWDVVERHGVTTLGTSPSGARTLRTEDEQPRDSFDLSTLRTLCSTGEPWDREAWIWYFEAVGGGHLPIINLSGGTELAGSIVGSTPLSDLVPGTVGGPVPGVAGNLYDDSGEPAEEGHLVIELPVPGMTHSLTAGDERYLDEYWRDFPDVWNQNDRVEIRDGFWYVTGRADDAMNVSGRRVTAPEIEEAILTVPGVDEAAVIDWQDAQANTVPVAFITTAGDEATDVSAAATRAVAEEVGAPFKPAAVYVVDRLPRTQTGKLPRGRFKDAYAGQEITDVSTLDSGEALDEFPRADDA